ncbi:hypothetical protein GW17_00022033 [Ensete ventricosum]|nr:hypothetical protein GW17_00022033 [Ensete ventricosum]
MLALPEWRIHCRRMYRSVIFVVEWVGGGNKEDGRRGGHPTAKERQKNLRSATSWTESFSIRLILKSAYSQSDTFCFVAFSSALLPQPPASPFLAPSLPPSVPLFRSRRSPLHRWFVAITTRRDIFGNILISID